MAEKRRGKSPSSPNLTSAYASVASDLMQRLGDAQAAQMGPPTSEQEKVTPAGNEERVKAWNARNPEATDEAMQAMAVQKYQEHLAAGMDPETAQRATAEDLTHYRYGQRLKLYTYGAVGFREQVELAERLAKIAARKSTPNPLPPPPTMPSGLMTNAVYTPAAAAFLGVPDVAAPAQPEATPAPDPFASLTPESPLPSPETQNLKPETANGVST